MRNALFTALVLGALPMISGCGYSVFDAAEDISEGGSGLKDGSRIGSNWGDTGSFDELASVGPDNIVFTVGEKFQIKAEADADTLDKLRFKLREGKLVVGRSNEKWHKSGAKPATIYITAPSLKSASLAGSGDLTADRMAGDNVSVSAAGSGNIDIALVDAKAFEAELAGSGSIRSKGKATKADYSIAGSGSIDSSELESATADVSIAGSGDARLNATGSVDVSIAGSGNVTVAGGAKCASSIIGSGKLNCAKP